MAKPSMKDLIGQKTKQSLTSSYISTEQIKQQIVVLDEFREFIPSLTPEEFKLLEENIIKNGCKDALILWETTGEAIGSAEYPATQPIYVLVDGHNRYQICTKHHIGFNIKVLSFASIKEVKDYMIDIQLGRRNLTPQQVSYFRGIRYNLEKSERGKYDRIEHKSQNGNYDAEATNEHKSQNGNYDAVATNEHKSQNGNYDAEATNEHKSQNGNYEKGGVSTSQKLAKEYKVGRNTILRDAEFAAGLDKLHPTLRNLVLSGELKISKSDIQKLAKASLEALIGSIEELNQLLDNQTGQAEKTESQSKQDSLTVLKQKLQKVCDRVVGSSTPTVKDLDRLTEIVHHLKQQLH